MARNATPTDYFRSTPLNAPGRDVRRAFCANRPFSSRLATRVYSVSRLIDRAQADFQVDRATAQAVVDRHLGCLAAAPDLGRPLSTAKTDTPIVVWSCRKLIVRQTEARHKKIATALDIVGESGFGQVQVEVQIVTGPVESIDALDFDWTILQPDIPEHERLTTAHERLSATPEAFPFLPQTAANDRSADAAFGTRSSVRSAVEKCLPTMIELMDAIARKAKVNLAVDVRGLAEEGVRPDEPVSMKLNATISAAAALELMLEPHSLTYVVEDEVG